MQSVGNYRYHGGKLRGAVCELASSLAGQARKGHGICPRVPGNAGTSPFAGNITYIVGPVAGKPRSFNCHFPL
jgi:hypothetical protein